MLRQCRLAKLIELDFIKADVKPHQVVADTTEWSEMNAEERSLSARAMEIYAGMVDRIDQAVGKVIDLLKETGEYDNTVIMFMSDNGAEGAALGSNFH